jgi:hypothetical protein
MSNDFDTNFTPDGPIPAPATATPHVVTTFMVKHNGKTVRELSTGAPVLAHRGIDYDVWARVEGMRGCWEYKRHQVEEVWAAFEPFIPKSHHGTKKAQVTKYVNQCTCPNRMEKPDRDRGEKGFWEKGCECPGTCGGWVMPKFSPDDKRIAPQLRPHREVVRNAFDRWHTHGILMGDPSPRFPEETNIVYPDAYPNNHPRKHLRGKPHPEAGQPKHLRRDSIMRYGTAECEAHINSTDGDPYDPVTGEGAHHGENYPGVHKHARETAKYILITPTRRRSKRGIGVDLHPLVRERLDDTDAVFLAMEGVLKTDAIITAGGCAFGIPSVTFWNRQELIAVAKQFLIPKQKRLYIVPDADAVDPQKPQVMRQAFKLRTLFRRAGVDHVFCAAPPFDLFFSSGKKIKGVDDYLGAGYPLDGLEIIGWEPPLALIAEATQSIGYGRTKSCRVLEDLSLYAHADGTLRYARPDGKLVPFEFQSFRKLIDIEHSSRVKPTLDRIDDHFELMSGSLDPGTDYIMTRHKTRQPVTIWKDPPTLRLDERLRAQEVNQGKLIRDMELLTARVDDHGRLDAIERWIREQVK